MIELEALRRAVVLHPGEDTPRLAYADALDEIGGKENVGHARVIRLMTEWERSWGDGWAQRAAAERSEFHRFKKSFRRNFQSYVRTRVKAQRVTGFTTPRRNHPWNRMARFFDLNTFCFNVFDLGADDAHTWCQWQFRRGFVTKVRCHWPHWILYGAELTENEPVEEVELTSIATFDGVSGFREPVEALLRSRYPRVARWTLVNTPKGHE